jgi:predicted  nucleic acid-binding Zn-ribbon protein/ribonuclease HI
MNEQLKRLIQLQELMRTSADLDERIAAVPAEVARLEKDLLAMQNEIDAARVRLEELQKDRRKLESDLMGVETKIQKYQAQLLEIKTNKEYQAMLKEIESCRVERLALDEKILLEMEEGDERAEKFRTLEERLKEKEQATQGGKKRLDELVASLKREKEAVEAERAGLEAAIPREYLAPFSKVARQRKGLALVEVREELCGGCHVRVMPKLIQQVRRATGLIACDSCKRYLYVPEETGGVAGRRQPRSVRRRGGRASGRSGRAAGRSPALVAHIDGGARGNPGPAGYGVHIRDDGGVETELFGYIGIATNNTAEYAALLALLEYAVPARPASLLIRSDSELLIRQMQGRYRVKDPGLRVLHAAARRLIVSVARVRLEHVPREMNREADALANRAMDLEASSGPLPAALRSLPGRPTQSRLL